MWPGVFITKIMVGLVSWLTENERISENDCTVSSHHAVDYHQNSPCISQQRLTLFLFRSLSNHILFDEQQRQLYIYCCV